MRTLTTIAAIIGTCFLVGIILGVLGTVFALPKALTVGLSGAFGLYMGAKGGKDLTNWLYKQDTEQEPTEEAEDTSKD